MINRLLIAEDNFVAQRVLETMVEDFAEEITIVATYQDLIQALQAKSYDVLLLDFHLNENADVMIPEVRKVVHARDKLAIYILSAEPEKVVARKLQGVPYDGYIGKPVSREQLQNALGQLPTRAEVHDGEGTEVNIAKLENLLGNNTAKVQRVISVFAKEAPAYLDRMEELLHRESWKELKEVVHRARAGYGYVGLTSLHQQLTEWEAAIEQGTNRAAYATILNRLREQTKNAISAIKITQ